jgi:hypothetical protein
VFYGQRKHVQLISCTFIAIHAFSMDIKERFPYLCNFEFPVQYGEMALSIKVLCSDQKSEIDLRENRGGRGEEMF